MLLLATLDGGSSLAPQEWDARMERLWDELGIRRELLHDPERRRWHARIPVDVEKKAVVVMPAKGWYDALMGALKTAPRGVTVRMPTCESRRLAERSAAKMGRQDLVFECVGEEE